VVVVSLRDGRLCGPAALQVAGAMVSAGIGLALVWQLRRLGPVAQGVTALALAGMHAWLVVRPATLSFLLIAVLLGVIEHHRRRATEASSKYLLITLPLGFLLWANAHGFATLGAGLWCCYALYRAACRLAQGRLGALLPRRDATAVWPTLLSAGLGLVASTLNVAGPTLRLGPSRFASDASTSFAFSSITEFAPTSVGFFLQAEPLGALVGLLALLALLLGRDGELVTADGL
jgi:hypothetical protein